MNETYQNSLFRLLKPTPICWKLWRGREPGRCCRLRSKLKSPNTCSPRDERGDGDESKGNLSEVSLTLGNSAIAFKDNRS